MKGNDELESARLANERAEVALMKKRREQAPYGAEQAEVRRTRNFLAETWRRLCVDP